MSDVDKMTDEELLNRFKWEGRKKKFPFLQEIKEDPKGDTAQNFFKTARIIHDAGWDWYEIGRYSKIPFEEYLFTIGDKDPQNRNGCIWGILGRNKREGVGIHFSEEFQERYKEIMGGSSKNINNGILYINNGNDINILKNIFEASKSFSKNGPTYWPSDYPPDNPPKKQNSTFSQTVSVSSKKGNNNMPKSHPLNQILYGPPGTGKTYATARAAVEICDGSISSEEREEIMERYYELAGDGRIEFITFHQSIAYEDFIEGLRPTSFENGNAGFELKSQNGIFRRIVTAALGEDEDTFSLGDSRVFKVSLGEYKDEKTDENIFKDAIKGEFIIIGYNAGSLEDSRFESPQEILKYVLASRKAEGEKVTTSSGWVSIPNIFRNQMQVGDFVIVSAGNRKFRAVGQVISDYYYDPLKSNPKYAHRRNVKWLWSTSNPSEDHDVTKLYKNNFSQATVYKLQNNLINKEYLGQVIEGISQGNKEKNKKNFVLIIDEINRANISKVFGELITLLEDDKRLGKLNALEVTLPYSGDKFGVPDNLYIIGTMNTADRSIALLDTALRRRFEFEELMPKPELLEGIEIEDIDLSRLLTTLNDRIEYLLDREHQIGHAFFINCKSKDDLDAVMRNKVIPLLAEYFYDDWASMAVVLGDAGLQQRNDGEGKFLECKKLKRPSGCKGEGNEDRYRWSVRSEFSDRAYEDFLKNTGSNPKEGETDEQAGL